MRIATIIILTFILSSCGLEPSHKIDNRDELDKIKGPELVLMEKTALAEIEQAESAGDFKHAAQLYKQISDKKPDNKDYIIAMSNDLRRAGENELAIKYINNLLKKDPKNVAALECKALTLMNLAEFADAGKIFNEIMKIDNKRWCTLNGVAVLFTIKKKTPEAIKYYNEALAQSPDNPNVLNNMGLTYAIDKQLDKAIETLTKAHNRLPSGSAELVRVDLNLALVYAISGNLEGAENMASPRLNKAALYNNMGVYSHLAKNDAMAKSYLSMALTNSKVYYEKAWDNFDLVGGQENGGDLAAPSDKPVQPEDGNGKNEGK